MTNSTENIGGQRGQGWRIARWTVIASLLALPLIAMQFTDEMQWSAFDFIFMGVLLIGAGLLFELAAWKIRKPLHRALLGFGVVGIVLVVWAEGAVGIFH